MVVKNVIQTARFYKSKIFFSLSDLTSPRSCDFDEGFLEEYHNLFEGCIASN